VRGVLEVIQDFPPTAVIFGTSAMALVNNNEIKEISGKLFVHIGCFVGSGKPLVQGQVNFITLINSI
jgi:hypothetical protein